MAQLSAVSTEAWLTAVITALYLKDCVRLLQPDEAMLQRGWLGHWSARFGARNFRLAHREPLLLNPFLPHQPAWLMRWRTDALLPITATHVMTPAGSLDTCIPPPLLVPNVWMSWALLFVVIPVGLNGLSSSTGVLLALALLYVNIVAGLIVVWRARAALGLDRRSIGLLSLECLACPPYAANLVRRVSGLRTVSEDFIGAASRLLQPSDLALAQRQCLARVDDQLDAESEGTPRALALAAFRQRLAAANGDPAVTR